MVGRAHGLEWLRSCDPGPRPQGLPGWLPPSGVTGFTGASPPVCAFRTARGTYCEVPCAGHRPQGPGRPVPGYAFRPPFLGRGCAISQQGAPGAASAQAPAHAVRKDSFRSGNESDALTTRHSFTSLFAF